MAAPPPYSSSHAVVTNMAVAQVPVQFSVGGPRPQSVPRPQSSPAQSPSSPSPSLVSAFQGLRLQVVKELVLRPYQVPWATKAEGILRRSHGYIDTSRMGSGKTYVTLHLAKKFGFQLFIVSPVSVMEVWKRTAAEYGVGIVAIISYQSLRSQKNHQPKHGYLQRIDTVTEGNVHQVHFLPTEPYVSLVKRGVLVIFDEIQNIKNNSDQYKACTALLRPVLEGGVSRWGLLSGTPFDKEEHAMNLLRLINYIRAHRMYYVDKETGRFVPEGIQELIDSCLFIDRPRTEAIVALNPPSRHTVSHLAYTLFVEVVKPNISGAMPKPDTIDAVFDVKDGYYKINRESEKMLREGLGDLAAATRYDETRGTVTMQADNIGAVTKALVVIENSKVVDFARVAGSILTSVAGSKVIIAINYTSTIGLLKPLLESFSPLILNGQVKPDMRARIVVAFNNDVNVRLLIMNTMVGGVGISLHDIVGNSPRYMLINPGYKMLDVVQATGRIYRDGTKSAATVRLFYGRGSNMQETGILRAMAKKSQVLMSTLEQDMSEDLVLPGDYPQYMEE